MYLLAARKSYFSLHLPPKTRFPENGSLLLIGQFGERNAELEWAAVSGEDRCVTNLITAAKETRVTSEPLGILGTTLVSRILKRASPSRNQKCPPSPVSVSSAPEPVSWKTQKLSQSRTFRLQSCFIHTFRLIKRFLIECRKTKTKVITLANHKGHR